MLEIKLDTSDWDNGIHTLLKNAAATHKIMHGIAMELLSMTEENFDSESFGGEKWKRSMRAAAENSKTLQDSGQLAASISTDSGNNFARIGTNKPYAAIHHLGGQAGKGKRLTLPPRPYLPVNGDGELQPDGATRLSALLHTALEKGI